MDQQLHACFANLLVLQLKRTHSYEKAPEGREPVEITWEEDESEYSSESELSDDESNESDSIEEIDESNDEEVNIEIASKTIH